MSGEGTVSAVATVRCWRRSEKERGPVQQKPQERPGRGEGGEAETRPCCVGCFSVPAGAGADGVTGAETTEVGMQWVFVGLWAVWLEQGGF